MICFLPGPYAFLQAPTKHPGKLSANLSEVLLGLLEFEFLMVIDSRWLLSSLVLSLKTTAAATTTLDDDLISLTLFG